MGSLIGAGAPVVLLACVLAVFYFVYLAMKTPGPYPFVADSVRSSKAGVRKVAAGPAKGAETAGSLVAGAGAAKPAEVEAVASLEGGEGLFNIYCVACHQAGGQGKIGFAPFIRNRDFLALASDEFLRDTIQAGRPGTAMVGWAHLKPHEIDSLVLYLRSAQDPDARAVVTVDPGRKHPGDPGAGEGLYFQYCAACHGESAKGYAEGGPGPAIGNAGFLATASDDYIFQTVKLGRSGTPMRAFSGSRGLANLSDGEIGDIIAYLRNRGEDAPVAVTAGDSKAGEMHFKVNCSACHQVDGKGRPGFAPSIRNRDFLAIASDEFIKETVHNGRPGTAMVQRPDLSGQVINDIIAYLRAVPTETIVKVELDPSKDLAALGKRDDGELKFEVFCASCHGDKGMGFVAGGSGPGIGLPGFLNAASDDYIYQTLKLGRIGTAMRPFLGSKGLANLNEQDAHDIIAYLRGLNSTGT